MKTGSIYLIGPSGNPNFGDEFIAASWLKFLAAAAPDTDVWLDCPQPGLAQVLFEGMHPRLHLTNTLWRTVFENAHEVPEVMRERVRYLVKNLGSPSYDLGLLKLRETRSLHLIGGGFINAQWAHHAGLVHGMRAVAEVTGAQLFATGQGLMPALEPSVQDGGLFKGFSHVTARDAQSAESYGVTHGIDDAFLGAQGEISRTGGAEGLYVCIQSDTVDPGNFDAAISAARPIVEDAVRSGLPVHYVEAIPGADRAAFDRLSDLIPQTNFLPFIHIWQHGLPLSSRQTWLTTRFHFHLLGAAAGASGIALGIKEGYYDVKHDSLLHLGSGWTFTTPDDRPEIPEAGTALSGKLEKLAGRKDAEARKLYPPSGPETLAADGTPAMAPPAGLTRAVNRVFRERLRR